MVITCDAQGRATLDDVLYSSSGLVTRQNAGAVSDSGNHNINGALAVDSTNGRIYFRYGGGWHYVNQTAGFEVPAHERICPVCSDPLLPGDDLIGRGDREGPDGALHGLWIHLGCAGKPTVPAIADDYWAASHHPDLDADPAAKMAHGSMLDKLTRKVREAIRLDEP